MQQPNFGSEKGENDDCPQGEDEDDEEFARADGSAVDGVDLSIQVNQPER